MTLDENDPRRAAIGRLKAKQAFKQNLVSYAVINVFLIIVWAVTSKGSGHFWPIWIMAGWGIGIAFHAWAVYGRKGITEADVAREMERGGGRID